MWGLQIVVLMKARPLDSHSDELQLVPGVVQPALLRVQELHEVSVALVQQVVVSMTARLLETNSGVLVAVLLARHRLQQLQPALVAWFHVMMRLNVRDDW